ATSAGSDSRPGTGAANDALLYQNNLQYLGAFRVPVTQSGGTYFSYGGTALAFNPANNSLFIVGSPNQEAVSEISIPAAIVNSGDLSDLATASYLQPFRPVLSSLPNNPLTSTTYIGGLMVNNGKL